jgi:flagellum-specific ATP synthase
VQDVYTPSVFAMLPKLLERAGTCQGEGSITGFYTVLVEGDDMNEPIADAVRGIIDGHFVLSRSLAAKGHYPAIEINQSLSRVMSDIVGEDHKSAARKVREILARYAEVEDLINIGAYKGGQNASLDFAVSRIEHVKNFLKQKPEDNINWQQSLSELMEAISLPL